METEQLTKDTTSMPIFVPYGEATPHHLHIGVGACRLKIRPAEGKEWVVGSYYGSVEALPLEISQDGGTLKIGQRHKWDEVMRLFDGVPTLELALGKAEPYVLTIESGASENYIDLGGLPLTRLTLGQGAGKIVVDFSSPNPQEMDRFSISSGASGIEIKNLANANFAQMAVDGGAASYQLDFGGTLRRDAHVKVSAAMSSVDVCVPASTPAKITHQAMMGGVNMGDGFMKRDGAYWTESALANLQPVLTMQVGLTMGSLSLYTR